jgi:putative nucleotidyltransferase with HDIG domain
MPSLSSTATKILQVANDPASSANDLNKVISLDPVLAGKVLKLVNSAYFGFQEKMTSTVRAIVVLGLNTIKNLALSTAMLETMKAKSSTGLIMDEYWKHLLATGVLAKHIARKININKNLLEDYFLCGLMHDIGKIVLNNLIPEGYGKIIAISKQAYKPLHLYETAIFGINHAEIGQLLGKKWGLQSQIVEAMAFHHSPSHVSNDNKKLVYAIIISNNYVRRLNVGFSGNSYTEAIGDEMWREMAINDEVVQGFEGSLLEGVERASIFLQTNKK